MDNTTNVSVISEFVQSLPILPGTGMMIRIFQTAGIIIIAYIIFLLIKNIIEYKRLSRIADMHKTLKTMNETLLRIEDKLTAPANSKNKNKNKKS